jgi:hypothetical protein
LPNGFGYEVKWKEFDAVQFKNGYSKDAPTMLVKLEGFTIDKGKKSWGAEPGKEYFVIKLGNIINQSGI